MKIANHVAAAAIAGALTCVLAGCAPTPGGQAIASYLKGQWHCETRSGYSTAYSFGDSTGTYSGSGDYTLTLSTNGDQFLVMNNAGQSWTVTAKSGVPVGQTATFEVSDRSETNVKIAAKIEGDSRFSYGKPGTDSKDWTVCTKS